MTTIIGTSDDRDPRVAGLRQHIAEREAREAELRGQLAARNENITALVDADPATWPEPTAESAGMWGEVSDTLRRRADAETLAEAREAARNAPPTRAEQVSADIRTAVHGDAPARPTVHDSIRAKSRDLAALRRFTDHNGNVRGL